MKQIKEQYAREEHYSSWRSMCEAVNIVPRDVSAIAERYADARVADLTQWKAEATEVMAPIYEWFHKQKDIPLGSRMTVVILERLEAFEQAKKALERIVTYRLSFGDIMEIANTALASWKEEGKEGGV